jgi:hypothetical protein
MFDGRWSSCTKGARWRANGWVARSCRGLLVRVPLLGGLRLAQLEHVVNVCPGSVDLIRIELLWLDEVVLPGAPSTPALPALLGTLVGDCRHAMSIR